jgi:hypothetical protein
MNKTPFGEIEDGEGNEEEERQVPMEPCTREARRSYPVM